MNDRGRLAGWVSSMVAGGLTMGLLDGPWIVLVAGKLYQHEIPHLIAAQPQVLPAAAFYLTYLSGVTALVVRPGHSVARSRRLRDGAILGAIAYGTWGFTGASVLANFPVTVALLDVLWGAFLTALVASVAGLAADWARRRAGVEQQQ